MFHDDKMSSFNKVQSYQTPLLTPAQRCVIQVARQFMHPTHGLEKEKDKPSTLKVWFDILSDKHRAGWINAGIEEEMGIFIKDFGIGELVPNTNPNLSIYKRSFFTQTILSRLRPVNLEGFREDTTHRVIMNYDSFMKFIKIIENELLPYERDSFIKEFTNWNKTIVPRIFWIHIPISNTIADIFVKNKIGEVIIKGGTSTFFNFYPNDQEMSSDKQDEDEEEMIKKHIKKREKVTTKFCNDKNFFRIIMNEKSILRLLQRATTFKIGIPPDKMSPQIINQLLNQDAYELFGGYMADLELEFNKLSF